LAAHLTFALKHEGVYLEFLARLFHIIPSSELEQWVQSEPTGQYARRIGFLYEWLSESSLSVDGIGGNYHDALDPKQYVTSSAPANNPRWRIRDNLPGTRDFCPLVHRTQRVADTQNYNCSFQDNHGQLSNKLKEEFPLLAELGLENQIAEIVHRAFGDTQNDL
jgi:hypothetical protein